MERKTLIEIKNADLPKNVTTGRNGLELEHNLRSVFHIGFIEKHKRCPKNGTNPLYDEYSQLLLNNNDWLIWEKPGISEGDLLMAESQILGRIFGRSVLSLNYNYRWFADLKTLKSRNYNKWKFSNKGLCENMPDWIIAGSNMIASAEAKGTHSNINRDSEIVESWSKQSNNVLIEHEGIPYKCKSWLIATRWVTEGHRYLPKIYIEDPDNGDFENISKDELPQLEKFISKIHTNQNLIRINDIELSKEMEKDSVRESGNIRRAVWSLKNKNFSKMRFIGNIINLNYDEFYLNNLPYLIEHMTPHKKQGLLRRYIHDFYNNIHKQAYFDGLEIDIVKANLRGDFLPRYENIIFKDNNEGSLLSDGSLLIPLSEVELEEEVIF